MFKLFKPGDLVIFIICFFSIILIFINSYSVPSGGFISIEKNNQTKEYSLSSKSVIELEGITIEINSGRVRVVKSSCKNQYCIMQGWISKLNQSILCLPNLTKITIKSNDNNITHDSTAY